MSRRPSLEALAEQARAAAQHENVVTSQRDSVETLQRENVRTLNGSAKDPKPLRAAPHMSLYVGKRVQKALKEIALEYDRKPHDILIEAIDLVLRRYGRPSVADLSDNV